MPATVELFKKYPNPIFIETGSWYGHGIQQAIDAGFNGIYSIELSQMHYKICLERFKNNANVHLILGDSHLVMDALLAKIDQPVTFWLDGHYSEGDTAMGKYESPLLQELEAIKRHKIKTHTIIIDDLRCWSKEIHGFDTDVLIKEMLGINKQYVFIWENGHIEKDILVATIKTEC